MAVHGGLTAFNNSIGAIDQDDDMSSIDDMKKEIRSLVKRKFELEVRLESTEPPKFGNVLKVLKLTSPPSNLNYREESQSWHLSKKLHFYKLCGIHAKREGDETRVYFRSVHNSEEYSVGIKKKEDHFEVTKHFLPPMVPLEELTETYLKNLKNISGFCRKIYHYIVVFNNRVRQITEFKNSEYIRIIEFFSSHSTHLIRLKVQLHGKISRILNIHLKYSADFVYPQSLLLDGGDLNDIEKNCLLEICQAFKVMPLLEALREVLPLLSPQ